ncbi:hypothetical protein SAMN05661080_01743 [Modestobacter sp. DSM 44400]|nr:hypothetical protein SAMN05661080_01743 [Modestobacter sp. DSM 44400]
MVTRPADHRNSSASTSARTPGSLIAATRSRNGNRCPGWITPASNAANVAGSTSTSVSDWTSNFPAADRVIDNATISSCAAHSLTGPSTAGRAARVAADAHPRSPGCRSTDAGRDPANSATARTRTAVCTAIARSAACTRPNGPDAHPTDGTTAPWTGEVTAVDMRSNLASGKPLTRHLAVIAVCNRWPGGRAATRDRSSCSHARQAGRTTTPSSSDHSRSPGRNVVPPKDTGTSRSPAPVFVLFRGLDPTALIPRGIPASVAVSRTAP